MSRCLSDRSIDHVVLERGEIAHSWRTERWDSLRLLTPNWQSRLPGYGYSGNDPDGYRTVPEVVEFIGSYARAIAAPVTDPRHRRVGAPHRGGLSRGHRPGRLAMPDARHRVRGLQHRRHAGLRRPGAALDRDADGAAVSQPRPTRRRRRPGGWRLGERHPDRQRNPAFGPSGDAGGRRAHSRAPHVSRQGPGVVDGRRRRARRALRRGRRHRGGRGGCRRCSSPARPTGRRSTSMP